jgi:hypothetical protein
LEGSLLKTMTVNTRVGVIGNRTIALRPSGGVEGPDGRKL